MEWPIWFIHWLKLPVLKHAQLTCQPLSFQLLFLITTEHDRFCKKWFLFCDVRYFQVVEAFISLQLEPLSIRVATNAQAFCSSVSHNKCCKIQLSSVRKCSKWISNNLQLTCGDRSPNLFVNPAHFLQIEGNLRARVNAAILNFERMKLRACAQIEPAEKYIPWIAGSPGYCEVQLKSTKKSSGSARIVPRILSKTRRHSSHGHIWG